MGIVDSGATASLASTDALECVRLANLQSHGDSKMQVDVSKSGLGMVPSQSVCPLCS